MEIILFELFLVVLGVIWFAFLFPKLQQTGRYRGLLYVVSAVGYIAYLLSLILIGLILVWLWMRHQWDLLSIGFSIFLLLIIFINFLLVLPERTREFKIASHRYFKGL